MRKHFWVLLVCAALLACGCSAGTPDAKLAESLGSEIVKEETEGETGTAEQKSEEKETTEEEKAEVKDTGKKETEEQKKEEEKTTEKSSEEKKEDNKEEKSEEKKSEDKKSEDKKSEEKKSEEKKSEDENSKEKDSNKKNSDKKKSDKKKSEKKKAAEEPQYIPDGFTPYGDYVLIYDSGYEVKTRYSEAGLTYYMESEEFFFKLNKDLPDMKQEVAHILFNTAAPMDPSNTEGEEFPFDESYIIYISLYDGSYYEVGRGSLDLRGRIFVRDVFETFRQKWEGAF